YGVLFVAPRPLTDAAVSVGFRGRSVSSDSQNGQEGRRRKANGCGNVNRKRLRREIDSSVVSFKDAPQRMTSRIPLDGLICLEMCSKEAHFWPRRQQRNC